MRYPANQPSGRIAHEFDGNESRLGFGRTYDLSEADETLAERRSEGDKTDLLAMSGRVGGKTFI
jgi:hypothetical protein